MELNSTVTGKKNVLEGLNNRLELAENTSIEHRFMAVIQTEEQKEQRIKKK